MKEKPAEEEGSHPHLTDWSSAQSWEKDVKMPLESVDNYLFVMECMIGTAPTLQVLDCIFDTSTSVTSTFATTFTTYSNNEWVSSTSPTYNDEKIVVRFNSIGINWQGSKGTDTFCLGGGDIHTTVCLEDHPFAVISSQLGTQQWTPPLK